MHIIKLFMTKQVHPLMLKLCLTRLENNRCTTYVTLLIMFRVLLSPSTT